MSSFVCSKKHYRKVRDLTYYLLKSNKRKWIHILSEKERQAYLFIIEQIRLAIRDLKEDNERSDLK